MKRIVSLLIVIAIMSIMVVPATAASSEPVVQPRWSYLDTVTAYLDINETWGMTTCEGRATAGEYVTVKVIVRLQQLTDTGWSTLKSWSSTGLVTAAASGNYAVYSGYTYRVSVTGYVYDDDGNIVETGSATDTYIYPKN